MRPVHTRVAPKDWRVVHAGLMSIEKESSGLPQVDVHRRTTKVNLSIVVGIAIFFAAMFAVAAWFWSTRN